MSSNDTSASFKLGHGELKNKSFPVLVDALRGRYVTDISCGATHTVALLNGGEVILVHTVCVMSLSKYCIIQIITIRY
jgi:hypothetical protein